MIEQDCSHSLVVAATNHPGILDHALFRRFDDILHYALPDKSQIAKLLKIRLAGNSIKGSQWENLSDLAMGLSYAEVTRAANEAWKDALIQDRARVHIEDIKAMLAERKSVAERLKNKSE